MASGVGRFDCGSEEGGGDGEGRAGGEVCLTCLLGCGLEVERFEGGRSVEFGGGKEEVMVFERGGEEAVVLEGGRGGLRAVVVESGGGERVAGSVRGGE